ncbi:DUF1116 domain-containing protein [Pseudacidovorax intermedius]|uniref:DUF1116 domain-containing protein n=1 Tax=Pseudacidovorax intermedius TaxID=433924 RepID=A0A147HCH3_9BURK|nr:DUF1116 domain-containing protein [Pseudacidovorax intermedius]KTT27661.1 hypothetical protein NS331_01160 [Pseudacidovorax intermedius]
MSGLAPHPADARGFEALVQVVPVLQDLLPAGDAFAFPPRTVLHAGPSFDGAASVPAPVLNSAAAAAVFEGWAVDRDDALERLRGGDIALTPAQDHRCAVPLASVLSPSQWVQVVVDANHAQRRAFSSLNGGGGPALRLGLPTPAVVAHLRWLNGPFAHALLPGCRRGIALLPIADFALSMGDDLHGRTAAATARLAGMLALGNAWPGGVAEFLAASPSFFLNLWMAATKCMLAGAEGIAGCSLVSALGANGQRVGIQLAGRPGHWVTAASTPPHGRLDAGIGADQRLPAIGDSALIEASGLGAMAFAHSPVQQAQFADFLPHPPAELADALLMGAHPAFAQSRARFGLAARQAAASRYDLVVALGIIDIEGRRGRIGGGLWTSTPELFQRALGDLHATPAHS